MLDESALRAQYAAAGQGHVFACWGQCSPSERRALLEQLRAIDPARVNLMRASCLVATSPTVPAVPDATLHGNHMSALWWSAGIDAAARGHVAVVLLAGGQGTRLGSADPKGCYDIGLPSHRSLFELHAGRVGALHRLALAAAGAAGLPPPSPPRLLVMTSSATRAATERCFAGCPGVSLFDQPSLPVLCPSTGRFLMATRSSVATAPDGNGSVFGALVSSGLLGKLQSQGVRWLHVIAVDNALSRPGDPHLVGFTATFPDGAVDASAACLRRKGPSEMVGVFARDAASSLRVLEYSEHAVGAEYDAANVCQHVFGVDLAQRLGSAVMPHHIARKRVVALGETVDGLKLESFISDAYQLAHRAVLLEVQRGESFAPVKDAEGACAARAAVGALHASWAIAAGAVVEGGTLELAPAVTYAGEGLAQLAGRVLKPCCLEYL